MKKLSDPNQALDALAPWVKIVIVVLLTTTLIGAAAFFAMQVALLMALVRIFRDETKARLWPFSGDVSE